MTLLGSWRTVQEEVKVGKLAVLLGAQQSSPICVTAGSLLTSLIRYVRPPPITWQCHTLKFFLFCLLNILPPVCFFHYLELLRIEAWLYHKSNSVLGLQATAREHWPINCLRGVGMNWGSTGRSAAALLPASPPGALLLHFTFRVGNFHLRGLRFPVLPWAFVTAYKWNNSFCFNLICISI